MSAPAPPVTDIRYGTARGRWVLLATVLGSGLAGIDATVVNVALPAIGRSFGVDFAALQWTITAYTLTLASLILLAGSLGDRFGRRRVFVIGVVWFAVGSAVCGLAPGAPWLIAARALQGVGAALLTPGSLAIIQSSFAPADRARAIGAWSGLGAVATAIGPFVGGWLIVAASWRWVFLINLPLAAAVVVVSLRCVPESRDPDADGPVDVPGAALAVAGLAGVTYAIIAAADHGAGSPAVLVPGLVGVLALVAFVVVEARRRHPMLPLSLFSSVQFSAANAYTFLVYGAFGGVFFLLAVQLQVVAGYSALAAGVALLPITVVMLALSARAGQLAQRIGPRVPMSVGPAVCAVGVLLMLRIGPHASYPLQVFPAVTVFALGLTLLVAPLTAAVLAAVAVRHAGIASGVNNAVARAASLLAVAALPVVAGITGERYASPAAFQAGFHVAVVICAVLLAGGGAIAYAFIRGALGAEPDGAETAAGPVTSRAAERAVTADPRPRRSCPVGAPPLEPDRSG